MAADKSVPMERFNGKPLIQVKVADGINKAKELLEEATSGKAPIFEAGEEKATKMPLPPKTASVARFTNI